MSLHEHAPGRFTVQTSKKDPLGGKPFRRCKRIAGRQAAEKQEQVFEAEALAWFEQRDLIRKARKSGLQVESPSIPDSMPDFPTYLESRYLPWFKEHRGPRMLRARSSAFMVLAEDLANVRLDEAEHEVDALVELWMKQGTRYRVTVDRRGRKLNRKPRPITEVGVNERLRRLREVLYHAYKKARILTVAPRVSLLTVKGAAPGADKPKRYFLPTERVAFLRCAPRDVADVFEVGRMLGFRPDEAFHAQVAWVDFRQRKVCVQTRECALCPKGKWIPKTGNFRTIDICPDLMPILRRLTKGKPDEALLFDTVHGEPIWRREGSGGRFSRTLRKAGLTRKGLSIYSVRHTFAADLITAGVPMKKVSALLGNSVRVCEVHYGHLIPGQTADAVKSLKAIDPWPAKPEKPGKSTEGLPEEDDADDAA